MQAALPAWEAGDVRRVKELLDRHRPQGDQPDFRKLEWYYLSGLYEHSVQAPTLPHDGPVALVAFSSDGREIASASGQVRYGFEIKVWDAQSRAPLRSLELQEANICAGAFSPDLETIAVGNRDGTIRLVSIAGSEPEIILSQHTAVQSVALDCSGKRIALGTADGKVFVIDARS